MTVKTVYRIEHEKDPAEEIRNGVGDLSDFKVGTARLLLGLYKRPEKIGGIFRPDSNQQEDIFQAKACLVLKCGPNTFKNDNTTDFGGFEAREGDWVLARMQDGRRLDVCGPEGEGWECLLIKDIQIGMILPKPWYVW